MLAGVRAWTDEVHHIIARIAYDIMMEKKEYSITCTNEKLAALHKAYPDVTDLEGNKYTMVEAATFVDYRYKPLYLQNLEYQKMAIY